MWKNIKIVSLLLLITATTFGQIDKNGGSLYSIFGLGELNYSSGLRTESMGVLGLSLYGDYTNTVNPAAWTKIQKTIFTSRFNIENISSTDGNLKTRRTNANFDGFNLSVPLNKGNGWIIDLGINSFSSVNYDTKFTSSAEGETYTQIYSGNGGLNRFSSGLSYIIFRHISIGAQFNYLFGNINKSLIIDFDNNSLFDTRYVSSNTISGFYINSGLIFHGFGKLLGSDKLNNLTLGLLISSPGKLNSSVNARYNRAINNTDTIDVSEGKLELPAGFGIGISNIFRNNLTISADVFIQQWDKYLYYGSHPEEIKNNLRAGLGIEYTPTLKTDAHFLKRTSYRLGVSYIKDYLKIKGTDIDLFSISCGVSLPLSRFNNLELLFKYYIRGKDSGGLIKDNVFRFGASVKISELWFLKPSDDF